MMTDDMANKFANAKPNRNGFMLRREHVITIKNLKSDPSIVITRADKGNGAVVMDKQEYVDKMMTILSDETKFKALAHV